MPDLEEARDYALGLRIVTAVAALVALALLVVLGACVAAMTPAKSMDEKVRPFEDLPAATQQRFKAKLAEFYGMPPMTRRQVADFLMDPRR